PGRASSRQVTPMRRAHVRGESWAAIASVSPDAVRHHAREKIRGAPEGPGPHKAYLGSRIGGFNPLTDPPCWRTGVGAVPPLFRPEGNPMSLLLTRDGPVTIVTINR